MTIRERTEGEMVGRRPMACTLGFRHLSEIELYPLAARSRGDRHPYRAVERKYGNRK